MNVTYFERLFARFVRGLIHDDVVLRSRQMLMLERVESALDAKK